MNGIKTATVELDTPLLALSYGKMNTFLGKRREVSESKHLFDTAKLVFDLCTPDIGSEEADSADLSGRNQETDHERKDMLDLLRGTLEYWKTMMAKVGAFDQKTSKQDIYDPGEYKRIRKMREDLTKGNECAISAWDARSAYIVNNYRRMAGQLFDDATRDGDRFVASSKIASETMTAEAWAKFKGHIDKWQVSTKAVSRKTKELVILRGMKCDPGLTNRSGSVGMWQADLGKLQEDNKEAEKGIRQDQWRTSFRIYVNELIMYKIRVRTRGSLYQLYI